MANASAWGFVDLEALFTDRVTTLNTNVIDTALSDSLAEWNRQIDAMTSTFVVRTTDAKRRYLIPGSGTLQPMDQHGTPLPVIPSGSYDVSFPIQGGGTAFGDNRITRALMTVGELNCFVMDAQQRDADWIGRHILASILDNTSWTYDDDELGNLTIQPLANNDATLYPRVGGTAPAASQHYIAQTAAIADATNPFDDLYALLTRYPSQSMSQIVAYVPTANIGDAMGLTDFIEKADPRIAVGGNQSRLTTDGAAMLGPGKEVVGLVKPGVGGGVAAIAG